MSLKTRLKEDNLNLLLRYCHPEINLNWLESLYTFCNYFSYPEHFIWINGKIWLKRCAYVTPLSDPWPCWILTFWPWSKQWHFWRAIKGVCTVKIRLLFPRRKQADCILLFTTNLYILFLVKFLCDRIYIYKIWTRFLHFFWRKMFSCQ